MIFESFNSDKDEEYRQEITNNVNGMNELLKNTLEEKFIN